MKLIAITPMTKMKETLSVIAFLALISISNSQLIVEYDFNGSINPSFIDPEVHSSQFLGQNNINATPGLIDPAWGWEDETFDVIGSQYTYGYFTLAPADPLNFSLTLELLQFDVLFNDSTANTGIEIYTSVDSFSTPIFVQPAQPSGGLVGSYSIDLTPFITPNFTGATTIRIAPFNSFLIDSTSLYLDNVAVYGTINVIPEINNAYVIFIILIIVSYYRFQRFLIKQKS